MDLYVYYDVPTSATAMTRTRVTRLQENLAPVRGRLLRRADRANDETRETWMEIYEGVDADFEVRLDAAVERLGIAAFTGPRHVERFVDLA